MLQAGCAELTVRGGVKRILGATSKFKTKKINK
jgi:hypothetical protein